MKLDFSGDPGWGPFAAAAPSRATLQPLACGHNATEDGDEDEVVAARKIILIVVENDIVGGVDTKDRAADSLYLLRARACHL